MLSYLILISMVILPLIWLVTSYFDEKNRKTYAERKLKHVKYPNAMWAIYKHKRLEHIEKDLVEKEGPLFGFNLFGKPTIMLAEPELIQIVLSKEFTSFVNRRTFETNDPMLSNFLSNVMDDKWKRLRSIVTPTFTTGKLRRMKPCVDDTIQTLVKNFDHAIEKSDVVNIKQLAGAFTMDTIIQVGFGVKVDSLVDKHNPVITNARKLFSVDMSLRNIIFFTLVLMIPKLANMLGMRFNGDVLDFFSKFSENIIKEKRTKYEHRENIGKANNFIELLLEAEKEGITIQDVTDETKKVVKFMTNPEIIAQCVLFFLAGYDTTATTISLACYELAKNPDKQELLYQEITEVLEALTQESKDSEEETVSDPIELVTFDSLNRFKYLEAVVNETLRLYPPATALEREAGKDIELKNSDGKTVMKVKKHDIVHIPVYALHRDPKHFAKPESFEPERFLGTPAFHNYAFLPFGSGPRNCIAKRLALMEAKLALLHLIRQFQLIKCSQTKIPMEFYNQNNFLSPKDILLNVQRRS